MEDFKKEINDFLKGITFWDKLHICYFIISLIFFVFVLILEHKFFVEWDKRMIAYFFAIVAFIISLVLMGSFFDSFSEETRKKWGQKKIKLFIWKNNEELDSFVGDDLIDLCLDSQTLLRIGKNFAHDNNYRVNDYSYIVLPVAKAYEGVLKKILVHAGLVTESQLLENPELSINSYFNPVGNQAIFASLKDKARNKAIPYIIYSTYQECRNEILHYDSYRNNRITLEDADFYIRRIEDAIEKAYLTFKPKTLMIDVVN